MKRLLFAVLMIVCSVSWAEWEIGTKDDFSTLYFDKSTIRKNDTFVKIWELQENDSIKNYQGKKYKSVKIYKVYDCKSEMQAIASLVYYERELGSGEVVFSGTRQEKDWEWGSIVPGSTGELMWKIACGKK